FDQNGNVWQWNDLDGAPGPSRGLRGGYWFSGSLALQAALFCDDATTRESNDVGFRLAGPALLGEPVSCEAADCGPDVTCESLGFVDKHCYLYADQYLCCRESPFG